MSTKRSSTMRARRCCQALLLAALASGSGSAMAQTGLSGTRAGLGLKPPAVDSVPARDARWTVPGEPWQRAGRPIDYTLYAGERDVASFGAAASELYAGIRYSLKSGWATSLEAGYVPESAFSARRYALGGQLHAPVRPGQTLNIGLKYLAQDSEGGLRSGPTVDAFPGSLYGPGLAPWGPSQASSSGYQLHMSYQYSPGGTVGLAFGRDVGGHTPLLDPGATGLRQLSFTGQHWLTPSWALSYDLLSDDIASPLRVQGLRLGVRYRFW